VIGPARHGNTMGCAASEFLDWLAQAGCQDWLHNLIVDIVGAGAGAGVVVAGAGVVVAGAGVVVAGAGVVVAGAGVVVAGAGVAVAGAGVAVAGAGAVVAGAGDDDD
jgi:hypothetical protein